MNQDLSTWCVQNVTSKNSFASRWDGVYDNGNARDRTPLSDAKTPVWGKCPSIATLVLTSDDSDNIITTSQVTLTATFSLSMSPTPTISISGVVTNVAMTQTSTDTVWTYFWQVPGSITSETNLNVTATATDTNSRTYVGTESLTITIDSFDPTLSFSDTDADNLLSATDSVTITASFNEAMTATPTISITGAVTNVIMIPQNGLILKGNSSFWNNGEPNNSGSNENVAELSTNKVNDIPSNISQKSIIEFSDNRNSTISNFTYVGSYQGHSYYKSNNSSNWTTSKDNAITLGGNLVVFNTEAEMNYIKSAISSGYDFHIGAYQDTNAANFQEPDGGWTWVNNNNNSYQYTFNVSNTLSDGTYYVTVAGTDKGGNTFAGTDSITFTLDTTAPTVTLTDTDSDNLVSTSEVVTITAGFSEAMTATPTISITGIVTSVIMTPVSGTNSYTFTWDTSSGTLSDRNLFSHSKRNRPYRKCLCSWYSKYHLYSRYFFSYSKHYN